MNPITEDKIEPYIEPLVLPLIFKCLFWLFVLIGSMFSVPGRGIGLSDEALQMIWNTLYLSVDVVSVLVAVYLALLWLKVIKPRALIKSSKPLFLQLRWIVVVVGLFVMVGALGQSFTLARSLLDSLMHPGAIELAA
jgi:hypothetical protein